MSWPNSFIKFNYSGFVLQSLGRDKETGLIFNMGLLNGGLRTQGNTYPVHHQNRPVSAKPRNTDRKNVERFDPLWKKRVAGYELILPEALMG